MYKDKSIAKPVLTKERIFKLIKIHLSDGKSTINNIRNYIETVLTSEGVIGEQVEKIANSTHTYKRYISNEDALLINECIYDLLYARAITPGVNAMNLELPYLHVSDWEKLKSF